VSAVTKSWLPFLTAMLGVHTDEERWACVRIAAIDGEARTISFDVTVWKLPTDPRSVDPARPDQARLVGEDHELGPVAGGQLGHGAAHVGLGGHR
jgi:hypothetical protein